ncbi:MAG: hypothetical protein WC966_05720 [Bradymonadales bacterium]|jgi:hypothetical protein
MSAKTISILDRTINLETAAMHVAPGGSVKYIFTAKHEEILPFLRALRDEIAYGMYFVEEQQGELKIGIYFGLADKDIFEPLLAAQSTSAHWQIERSDVAEGAQEQAYTMASRNAVLA